MMMMLDAGIGAGLESMTTNPMAWEGSVNPAVLSLNTLFSVFLTASVEYVAHYKTFYVIAGEEVCASTELSAPYGCYFRKCSTPLWCLKEGARSSCCKATEFLFSIVVISDKFINLSS